jgi:hypothetical protein
LKEDRAALAARVTGSGPADVSAARAGDSLAAIVSTLDRAELDDEALALADAAILANPAHGELRQLRVALRRARGEAAVVIDDLRLLAMLAPGNPQLVYDHANVLIEERGDLARGLGSLADELPKSSNYDPRLIALRARMTYLTDNVQIALAQATRAAAAAPDNGDYLYLAGVYSYLLGSLPEARTFLARVPRNHPFMPRVRKLLEFIAEREK